MARKINRLNARVVATITKCGRHADGGGLYLSISPNGGRRWVFLYRWLGKPTEIGFGSARDVTLARARELARKHAPSWRSEAIQRKLGSLPKPPRSVIAQTG
jgi:Arm DNA-binding domain